MYPFLKVNSLALWLGHPEDAAIVGCGTRIGNLHRVPFFLTLFAWERWGTLFLHLDFESIICAATPRLYDDPVCAEATGGSSTAWSEGSCSNSNNSSRTWLLPAWSTLGVGIKCVRGSINSKTSDLLLCCIFLVNMDIKAPP